MRYSRDILAIGLLFGVATCSFAQETRLPRDETVRYAKLCVEQADLSDAPVPTRPDPEKACAEKGEGGGAMVIPDRDLAKLLVSQRETPVGQLWLRKWTLADEKRAVPKKSMRVLTLNIDDKARPMPVCLLSVRKSASGDLQLLVYGKDLEPLQSLPLKRVEFEQDLPVIIEWQRGERSIDQLLVRILGRYETMLFVTRQTD